MCTPSNTINEEVNGRKLTLETIKNFKLGFVKKNLNLFYDLVKKFGEKSVKECGIFYFDEKKILM